MDVLGTTRNWGPRSESDLPPTFISATAPTKSADSALGRSAINQRQESFASVMSRADRRADHAARPVEQRSREAAEQFVSITFLQPVLKSLRSSTFATGPFAPSAAEKQFQSLYDAELAQRLTKASHWPLIDRIAEDLRKGTAKAREASSSMESTT